MPAERRVTSNSYDITFLREKTSQKNIPVRDENQILPLSRMCLWSSCASPTVRLAASPGPAESVRPMIKSSCFSFQGQLGYQGGLEGMRSQGGEGEGEGQPRGGLVSEWSVCPVFFFS